MIDVGDKPVTRRRARAGARVRLAPAVVAHIRAGTLPKGDVLGVARVAAITGSKQTPGAAAALPSARAHARRGDARARRRGRRDRGRVRDDRADRRRDGGDDGLRRRRALRLRHDEGHRRHRADRVGRAAREGGRQVGPLGAPVRVARAHGLRRRRTTARARISRAQVLAERARGRRARGRLARRRCRTSATRSPPRLARLCDDDAADVVLSTGGTGFAPRDVTPEAARATLERLSPGIDEALRADALRHTPHGALSRGVSGTRGRTIVITLPGSPQRLRGGLGGARSRCSSTRSSCCAPSRRRTEAMSAVAAAHGASRTSCASSTRSSRCPTPTSARSSPSTAGPGSRRSVWITVAMVGARSFAMAVNRLVDAAIDARNPRTAGRELPAGPAQARRR